MSTTAHLQKLREKYPWPSNRPEVTPVNWALDGGGRRLVTEAIRKHKLSIILEVGVFLGGSVKAWLEALPNVTVLAVDPWKPPWGDFARQCGRPEIADQLDRPDGAYETFLTSMWEYRDRVIPIRGYSQEVLYQIAEFGVTPELLYLDGDKSGREIEICNKLFPGIMVSGDDWLHESDGCFPIRKPVRDYCREQAKTLRTDRHTWLVSDEPLSWSERIKRPIEFGQSAERRVRRLRKRLTSRIFKKHAA